MTTEEKAKAYDDALDRMKHLVIVPKNEKALQVLKETIFPELAESEDERVIRALETFLNQQEIADKITFEARIGWLTWLEKQKENHKSSDSIPPDCTSDAKCEDRWYKVEDSLPDNGREVLAKDTLGNLLLARYDGEGWDVSVYDDEDYRCHNGVSKWCEIPPEKQKECLADNSKTSASEDERIRKQLIDAVKIGRSNNGISFTQEAASRYIAWLEKHSEEEIKKIRNEEYTNGFNDATGFGKQKVLTTKI